MCKGRLQRRIITGSHGRVPHDQGGPRLGVSLLKVVVDLGGTLAASQNRDVVRLAVIVQQSGQGCAVLGRMHDSGVLRQARRHLRGTSDGHHHLTSASRGDVARLHVARLHREKIDHRAVGVGLARNHLDDLLAVAHDVGKPLRAPAHVVLELQPSGEEGAQVGEMDQTVLLVKVVEEGKAAAGIAEGGQVLDKRDLHSRARNEHAGVPCELFLSLEEADLGLPARRGRLVQTRVQSIVKRNADCQGGGSESHAKKVVKLVMRRGPQAG